MLNNFCFDVFAQKWVFVIVTCYMSHVTCRMWHVTCLMSNAYVGPWDMLNNFCFHVYIQKWVFVIFVICNIAHVTCNMSHCACHMSYVKCLCWSLGDAEQLLFSCLCSKVSICNYVTCHMSHVTFHMSHVRHVLRVTCAWAKEKRFLRHGHKTNDQRGEIKRS